MAGDSPVLVHNCGPSEKFDVPTRPGVYTVHLEDGSKYVGMATRNMRDRVNATMKDGHSVSNAGYSLVDIKNVTWIELPRGFGGRRASRDVARRLEQSVTDGWKELGANVINEKYPEYPLWYH
jgi:hypothetical protein